MTSYISGFSTSVVNVRDQARAIENKAKILSNFNHDIKTKVFTPESYDEEMEREYQEQLKVLAINEEKEDNNSVQEDYTLEQ